MACCLLAAFVINRFIATCEYFDIKLLEIKYNDFDDGWKTKEEGVQLTSTHLVITGMTCATCTATIERVLQKIQGVEQIDVSLSLETATIVYDALKTSPEDLIREVEQVGYGAQLYERPSNETFRLLCRTEELSSLRRSFNAATLSSSAVLLTERLRATCSARGWGRQYTTSLLVISLLLSSWVKFFDSRFTHRSAWTRGKQGLFTMDTLTSLSLLLGMTLSLFNLGLQGVELGRTYFTSGSFLATVIIGGKYLDALLKKKNMANLAILYRMESEAAVVKVLNGGTYIPAASLRVGQEIVLAPNSVVPCDCYILDGMSTVDQSTMTGESLPVKRTAGDFVCAGTRNLSAPLVAVVHREQYDSSLHRLIDSIAAAAEQKLNGQERMVLATTYFVTGILILTAVGFAMSYVSSEPGLSILQRINVASERAMAILAAACPCVLGLAVPSASMAGIDAAWSQGVLFLNGARTIENLTKLTHVVMDKTGTLTEGRLQVVGAEFTAFFRTDQSLCYRLVCAAERTEAEFHPVGRALFQWALRQMDVREKRYLATTAVRNFSSHPGKGLSCEVEIAHENWRTVHIGSMDFLHNCRIPVAPQNSFPTHQSTMEVYFAVNFAFAGSIHLQDAVRAEAANVVSTLKSLGLEVSMLTGDAPLEAARVSSQLSIPVLASKSLPAEKHSHILALQAQGAKVAMIGDGINDGPAQAAADVGILLSPSPITISGAADILVMSPTLLSLPRIMNIARMTKAQARRNIMFAVVYNATAISLAMGVGRGWGLEVNASAAGTMMAFSSLGLLGSGWWLRQRLKTVG
ncbi:hypothetical protein PV08_11700 [Exophiala spinifera]|uniref:HMA domain-containing protein n=1 Tax=Exophiala spinifera TaxID=91928 RepID=A0A0D2BEY2_9EURO|nr:uncharacterized protein PV08_11700 [Exophiala spinifera]KIW09924.1 hypothetical protein PV08_11700 [Exophiala spinifera]